MKYFTKENKIIVTIILACLIIGGFIYASQISKQKSIERQQQVKVEQDQKEYIVKRKKDCYDYETSERKKFNNVDGSFYDEENDVCKVRYVNKEWTEGDPKSCDLFEKFLDKTSTCTIERFIINEF